MSKDFLTIIEKDTPKQLRVEFDRDFFEKTTLLKSGQSKDFTNVDVFLPLAYFNSMGFDIVDTFRMMLYLLAQKYPKQDFDNVLKDLSRKMPKNKLNPSKPVDIYSGFINSYEKGGENYASFSSFFFSKIQGGYQGKMGKDDFELMEAFFAMPIDYHSDALEEEKENRTLLEKTMSKTLEDVDVDILAQILNLSPLGVLASQTNNLHKKAKELNISSQNTKKESISEKEQRKKDKIAFIELGILVYVGYTPEVIERIRKRIDTEKFSGEIEMVFLNK